MDEVHIRSIYDYPEYYPVTSPGCDGDIAFYVSEALQSEAPVLELGCGTGRTLLSMAKEGVNVIGIDNSRPMLAVCQTEIGRGRLTNAQAIYGDMRALNYEEEFRLVTIPYRAFLCLHTVSEQVDALAGIYRSLAPGGKLILNVFDPDVKTLAEFGCLGGSCRRFRSGMAPDSEMYLQTWAVTTCDFQNQIIDEIWKYELLADDDTVSKTFYGRFKIRYVFRYEMEHLLHRTGFVVEELYGNFDRSEYKVGREQIWVCCKA